MTPPPALVSIHDVMPETLSRVQAILDLLRESHVPPVTLLVVPGRGWDQAGLGLLGKWAGEGHRLAGHGWEHRALPPTGLYHRLHGWLVSRDQAEHLSRSREDLLALVRRTHAWFGRTGLPAPALYVPPAWALGALDRDDLKTLPFPCYEVLRGLIHGHTGRLLPLPLVGFEADTRLRWLGLKVFNAGNRLGARLLNSISGPWGDRTAPQGTPGTPGTRSGRFPLRISIHPFDLEYLLAADLRKMLREPWTFLAEEEALGGPDGRASPGAGGEGAR